MQFKWHKISLIETFCLLAVIIWIFLRFQHTLNQLHPEWILLALGLGFLWCLRHNLYLPIFLLLLLAGILLHQWFVILPNSLSWLQKEVSAETAILLNGRIQERSVENDSIRLKLNSVELIKGKRIQRLPEAVISFTKNRRRISSFYRGRQLQVIGRLHQVSIKNNRLHLTFVNIRYRNAIPPQSKFIRKRNSWIRQLIDRAEFHLSKQALALYLPLTLAKRSYGSRSTAKVFQETGMAHLLAISGLHIGLIYGIILGLVRGLGRLSVRFLEHPANYAISQIISLTGIWFYLLLIGLPTPAFRAVFMLTILVAGRLLGQAHQPLYALFATAFFFIFLNPAVIYEVSFQLSFVAVFFILWFLPLYPHASENDLFSKRLAKYVLISIAITSAVMLGTWPVVASIFGRLSLETFWLNLIMVLLLAILVLPSCLLALVVSAFSLGNSPLGIYENSVFSLTELVVESWFSILKYLHQWGEWASFELSLDWGPVQFMLYYSSILVLGKILIKQFSKVG
ncbi:MAG: ComEC/Rec2 family competence protein [SAR324 cluster bacterium]|nr:ComEC/Rec2 family competence protein [SAR324 cluster bacterium]MBL7034885.1 ComEC/Rec2 family competence protein [SAR324 cluster bacterium]